MDERSEERRRMVEQFVSRGLRDEAVLAAMRAVPREAFIAAELAEFAYEDAPLPIEAGQTISQPYIVAAMTAALELAPRDRVLEVGTGSGYAAAVLSRIAAEVYTIERHEELAQAAERRLRELGYANVHVHHGDGTLGWPEHAPYDAIVVAAGGPEIPKPLLEQLAVGGTAGDSDRTDAARPGARARAADRYRDIYRARISARCVSSRSSAPRGGRNGPGPVRVRRARPRVVPRSWRNSCARRPSRSATSSTTRSTRSSTASAMPGSCSSARRRTAPRSSTGCARASPASSSCAAGSRWSPSRPTGPMPRASTTTCGISRSAPAPWKAFTRFPTWMWRNREVQEFVHWLHEHNRAVEAPERRAGFYGLDLYSLYTSIAAVLRYLDGVDPDAARVARARYGCLTPWEGDPAAYGRAVVTGGYRACEEHVVAMLRDMLDKRLDYQLRDGERYLDALQNARVVANAERYYRAMYYGSRESWNLRDQHMFETLQVLLAFRGPDTKAVVWEHNSHIGNAAATEMGARGEFNVGQLARETFGDAAYLVGFGTDHGTVAAASDWDGPMQVKSRAAGTSRELRAALPRRERRGVSAGAPRAAPPGGPRRARGGSPRARHRRRSIGRRRSSRATTSRPSCPRSSTSTCGSTRPTR